MKIGYLFLGVIIFLGGWLGVILKINGGCYIISIMIIIFGITVGLYGLLADPVLVLRHEGVHESRNEEYYDDRRCPQCGRIIPFDSELCPYCGFDFDLKTKNEEHDYRTIPIKRR